MAHGSVNVLEEKFVETVVEPFPHVSVFVHPTDAPRCLRHVDVVKLAEGDRNTVVDDVFIVEELTETVTDTEKRQRVKQLQVQIYHDAVEIEEVHRKLGEEKPKRKPHEI